jgi:hypothetical protein
LGLRVGAGDQQRLVRGADHDRRFRESRQHLGDRSVVEVGQGQGVGQWQVDDHLVIVPVAGRGRPRRGQPIDAVQRIPREQEDPQTRRHPRLLIDQARPLECELQQRPLLVGRTGEVLRDGMRKVEQPGVHGPEPTSEGATASP